MQYNISYLKQRSATFAPNKQFIAALALAVSATFSGSALASAILLDRGLPTTNLNNAAGDNRSNVAWADARVTDEDNMWVIGDTFTNTSAQAWQINTIRMWTVRQSLSLSLLGGLSGGSIGVVGATGLVTPGVLYTNSSTYQATSGGPRDIFQVDFAVNFLLAAGATYDFYLNGIGDLLTSPFAHASNAALSGSTQDGADNRMIGGQIVGGDFDSSTRYTWTSLGNGWDKPSDLNVQVFGTAVPEPGSLALTGLALFGLVCLSRRKASRTRS